MVQGLESFEVPPLTIGMLAKQSDVSIETIRFYERQGLIPEPSRDPSSGYRKYEQTAVLRLQFITRAKDLGFTLREVGELLELRSTPDVSCGSFRSPTHAKLEDVRNKIRDLRRIEKALESLANACPGAGDVGKCPILAALNGGFETESQR